MRVIGTNVCPERKRAVDFARNCVRLEGFTLDEKLEYFNFRFITGEISSNDLSGEISELHKTASSGNGARRNVSFRREAALAFNRIRELTLAPLRGDFDRSHLAAIHRHIFQDLPPSHPGAVRSDPDASLKPVLLAVRPNGGLAFSTYEDVASQTDAIFDRLLDREPDRRDDPAWLDRLAALYVELEAARPFYRGNSPAMRVFIRQLAAELDCRLDWRSINPVEFAAAVDDLIDDDRNNAILHRYFFRSRAGNGRDCDNSLLRGTWADLMQRSRQSRERLRLIVRGNLRRREPSPVGGGYIARPSHPEVRHAPA